MGRESEGPTESHWQPKAVWAGGERFAVVSKGIKVKDEFYGADEDISTKIYLK